MKNILLLFFTMMLTTAFAVPAMALVQWETDSGQQVSMDAYLIYGTWWHATDEPADEDDADLEWSSWGGSLATVSFTSDKLSGTYQMGFSSDWGQVTTRLIHATYTVNDDMSIQLGKMYAPWFFWGNSRAAGDAGMTGHGAAWDWFDPAIVLRYKGAFIEFMEPVTDDLELGDSKNLTAGGDVVNDVDGDPYEYEYEDADTDATLPRVYVGYDYSSDGLLIGGALGYNTYKIGGTVDKTVNAWAAHLHADVKVTDMLALRTGGHYAINPAQLHYASYDDASAYRSDEGKIKDATAIAGFVELSAVFGDKTARIGYGYRSFERDDWQNKDDRQTYYAQMVIPIYKSETGASFNVYPEIAVFDEMKDEDGDKEAKSTYIGAVWQIGF